MPQSVVSPVKALCDTLPFEPDLAQVPCSLPFRVPPVERRRAFSVNTNNTALRGVVASASGVCEPAAAPLVAHCVSGLVRSFLQPNLYKSLRHNVVDAFGGHAALLLMLKTFDTAQKVGWQIRGHHNSEDVRSSWSTWDNASRLSLRRALETWSHSA